MANLRIPLPRGERNGAAEPVARRSSRRARVARLAGAASLLLLAGAGLAQTAARNPAQEPARRADVIFEHLDHNKGLPSPIVQGLAQDGDGFLWVGTGSGVSRWDGYRFHNYQFQIGVPGSLPDNDVYSMYTDPAGTLWIGTRSGGVVRYDAAHDRFQTFAPAAKGQASPTIYSMVTDGERGLWVGSRSGLYHLDPVSGRFNAVAMEGAPGPVPAMSLLRDRAGHIWVATPLGLYRSNPEGADFARQEIFGKDTVRPWRLLFDHAGRLWIGTTAGAWVLEPSATEATQIHETEPGPSVLDQTSVDTLCEAQPGVIWLGTLGAGIVAVDEQTHATHRITHDAAYPTSLPSDSVVVLLTDAAGSVWAGTTQGVGRANPGGGVLTFFGGTGVAGQTGRIADTDITSVLPVSQDRMWLGLNANGVELVSLKGAELQPLRHIAAGVRAPLPGGQINALATGPDGSLYIGTTNWVFRADPDGSHLTALSHPPETAIYVDGLLSENGTLWIGSRKGLWKMSLQGSMRQPPQPVALPLTTPETTVLARGAGNDLWIATANELVRYNTATQTSERIPVDPKDAGGLPAPVTSVLVDREGRLWATTWGAGVVLLDGRDAKGKPRFRTLVKGLPNANADDILQAPDGKLWVSTDDGFATIDPQTFAIRALRQADGIAIPAYWVKSGANTPDGRLIFGGDGGVTVVDPAQFHPWSYVAPVVVTDILAGGLPAAPDLFNQAGSTPVLAIQHDANRVEVGFAALDYTGPERERYAYKLDGFEKNWIPAPATRRVASYTNLPPGSYTLELRGSNRNGDWGPVRRLRIRVIPAWYQTLWARIGAFLLLLLVLTVAYRSSTAYMRARQHELERRVEERTAEIRRATEELEASRRQLEEMAHSDALTGLPNRRMFTDYFRRLLASAQRHENSSFTLVLFDLDKFKEINDAWGHDAGDAWLKEVAERVNSVMRQSDCFARVGGDEFAVLVANAIDQDGIAALCARVARSVSEPLSVDQAVLTTTLSIGTATYPQDGVDETALFKAADVALYRVKHAGGNSWQRYSDASEATPALTS